MADIQITEQDQGRTFEAKQGDFIFTSLVHPIGSAYCWEAKFDSQMLNFRTIPDPSYHFESNKPQHTRITGGSRLSTYTFRALRPGTTKIILELTSQLTKEVGRTFDVTVNIREAKWPT